VTVRSRPEGNSLVLAVSDTGTASAPTISPGWEILSSRRVRRTIAAMKALALSLGRARTGRAACGAIAVESALKLGTTVTVRLPLDGRSWRSRRDDDKIETIARRHAAAQGEDIGKTKIG